MKKSYLFLLALSVFSMNAQLEIDFDAMTLGNVSPQSPYIETWPLATPTDAQVSDVQSYSAPNSLLIRGQAGGIEDDILINLGNKNSGIWEIKWMMYVPSGHNGFWNIQEHESLNPAAQWNGQFYVDFTGSGGSAGTVSHDQTPNSVAYTNDVWFEVSTIVDLNAGEISVYIDGAALFENIDYEDTNGVAASQVGAVNFYSIDGNTEFYIDDFVLVETCHIPEIFDTNAPAGICEGSSTTLTVSSNGQIVHWFDAATGGNSLGTGSAFQTGPLNETTSFWVEAQNQTSVGDICASDREEVVVNVIPLPDLPGGDDVQNFTPGETLADLDVLGESLTWYANPNGTVVLPDTTTLIDGTTYYVSQTIDGCESDLLAVTVFEPLGVNENSTNTFSFYPNPATGEVYINAEKMIDKVTLYNIQGQNIMEWQVNSAELKIDLSALNHGVYFLKVMAEGRHNTQKLIKN